MGRFLMALHIKKFTMETKRMGYHEICSISGKNPCAVRTIRFERKGKILERYRKGQLLRQLFGRNDNHRISNQTEYDGTMGKRSYRNSINLKR